MPPRQVVVDVYGYGTLNDGTTMSEVHREALSDALQNAVLQAHVSLDVRTRVEDLRLKEHFVRSRGMGYVESSQVTEVSFMPNTHPPIYRIRMDAHVHPLPSVQAAELFAEDPDRWHPVVALTVRSTLPDDREHAGRETLAAFMRECGIRIVDSAEEPESIVADVTLTGSSGDEPGMEIEWTMGSMGPGHPADSTGIASIQGSWLIVDDKPLSDLWWSRVGAVLAQDARKLWAMPRLTEIVLPPLSEDRVRGLSDSLGSAISAISLKNPSE